MQGALLAAILALLLFLVPAHAKDLHRRVFAWASWYGNREGGERMANGKRFDPTAMTCASRTYPLNTILQVTSAHSKKKVIVTVTDRGPWVKGLSIDLFREPRTRSE